ncbi:hypothetical protein JHW43_002761 [Diplocarpon mali]|nr:hypothetical protein JHW43_002761 [Diplocarpon mali]
MSDSDPAKKDGVQSWQQRPVADSVKIDPAPTQTESRETVISLARKFLEEDNVRDASTDRKIAFLESKGLQREEIQTLLGVTQNVEVDASSSESPELTNPPPRSIPHPLPQYTPQIPSQPPIVTYPEFLTTPQHPTPLITKPRLLTALYLFSGLTALLYGTHEYLLTPMLASLTSARLSLASTSKSNLEKLVTILETLVSEIPADIRNKKATDGTQTPSTESDPDPTEMFHRDIGIQTSPPLTRPSSPTPLHTHVARLGALKDLLKEIVANDSAERHEISEVEGDMGGLKEYLNGIAYVPPSYGYVPVGWNSRKQDDDEIARLKKEIRGVKGVLLSARSFPAGGGVKTGAK